MYTLFTKRVIGSVTCWPRIGNYDSLAECEAAIVSIFHLDAYVLGPLGERYNLHDKPDPDNNDYVILYFALA